MSTKISLRPYQEEFIGKIREQFKRGKRRVCGVAPCGSGKTIMTAWIAKKVANNGKNVLFMVHRQELIEQTSKTFADLGIDHGVIASSVQPNYDLPVQVASVQTLVRRLDKLPTIDLLICDDCHHILAGTYKSILNSTCPQFLLGVTATPIRYGGLTLHDAFDDLVIGPSVNDLIKWGNLADFDYFAPPSLFNASSAKTVRGDFSEADMMNQLSSAAIIGDIVSHFKKLAPNKQAICYCVNVKHSKMIADSFKDAGVNAEHVDGNTPASERAAIVNDFRNGNIQIMCNAELFGEGFDVPNMDCVILARPTQSLTLFIQQAMRPLRPVANRPDKRAIIIDHVGNIERHGSLKLNRLWSLDEKPKLPKNAANFLNGNNNGEYHERTINQQEGTLKKIVDFDDNASFDSKLNNMKRYIDIARIKGYKTGWIAKQCLSFATSYSDFLKIADICGYKKGWAWYQWQNLKDNNNFEKAWSGCHAN